MNELSLFSGAGGGLLGSKLLGWRCVGYVENEDYCQRVIAQRIKDGILDEAPIFSDIRAFIGEGYADSYQGMVDVITAGFPCQPFSVAGKRKGEMDERNMWPPTIEAIRRVKPRFALLENVPGLLSTEYFGTILKDLAESGYDARWKVISAAELGAPIERKRLFIVGVNRCFNVDRLEFYKSTNIKNNVWEYSTQNKLSDVKTSWLMANGYGSREVDGVDSWMDRLKAIGNGQVPEVVRTAWELLTGGE